MRAETPWNMQNTHFVSEQGSSNLKWVLQLAMCREDSDFLILKKPQLIPKSLASWIRQGAKTAWNMQNTHFVFERFSWGARFSGQPRIMSSSLFLFNRLTRVAVPDVHVTEVTDWSTRPIYIYRSIHQQTDNRETWYSQGRIHQSYIQGIAAKLNSFAFVKRNTCQYIVVR